jgi:hypothetical protein
MPNSPNAIDAARGVDDKPRDSDKPQISDDECLDRLAKAVQHHDASQDEAEPLDEVAFLIGRLAVAIE